MSSLSQKIREHELAPKKTHNPDSTYQHKIHIPLPMHKADLFIYFNISKEEEDIVRDISYELSNKIPELGMIDLYFSLVEGRALESLNRITTKEFDYYLRDDVKKGIFDFYDDKFYELLSIGEDILKTLKPSDEKEKIYSGGEDDFYELSMSEQIEIMEEFFAQTIYKHPKFHKLEVEVEDIETYKITFFANKASSELLEYLQGELKDKVNFQKTVILLN